MRPESHSFRNHSATVCHQLQIDPQCFFPTGQPAIASKPTIAKNQYLSGRNCQRPRREFPKCQIDSSKVQPADHDDLPVQCESERASSEPSLGRRQSLLEKERLKRQRAEWENFRKTAEQMRSPENRARRSEQRKRSPSRPSPSNRRCVTCSSIRQIRPMLCSRVDRISTALS